MPDGNQAVKTKPFIRNKFSKNDAEHISQAVFRRLNLNRAQRQPGVDIVGGFQPSPRLFDPAQFVNEVRSGSKIIFCPYCSRVLYYQEAEEQSEQLFVDIESGSLSDLSDYAEEGEEEGYDEEGDEGDKDSSMEESEE